MTPPGIELRSPDPLANTLPIRPLRVAHDKRKQVTSKISSKNLCCIVYYAYTNIHGNIINCNDNFNKRSNTLLYKNISLTRYSRKGDVYCEWEMSWRQGQTAILTQVLLSTIAALLPPLGWVAQLWVKLVLTPASCLRLTRTARAPGYIISNAHTLPLFFRLFTQVHLLTDGSVEGQYITFIL